MSVSSIQPPGDKIQKAILEFSELLTEHGESEKKAILLKIIEKHDLSPLEGDFLRRQYLDPSS